MSTRAVVARTPGPAETLQRDWWRAARFYGRFGINERIFIDGVPTTSLAEAGDAQEQFQGSSDSISDS